MNARLQCSSVRMSNVLVPPWRRSVERWQRNGGAWYMAEADVDVEQQRLRLVTFSIGAWRDSV